MTERIVIDCNGRKYITREPKLHADGVMLLPEAHIEADNTLPNKFLNELNDYFGRGLVRIKVLEGKV